LKLGSQILEEIIFCYKVYFFRMEILRLLLERLGDPTKKVDIVTLNGTINNSVSLGLTSIQMLLDSSLNGKYWQLSHYATYTQVDVYTKKIEEQYTRTGWATENRYTSVPEYKEGNVTLVSCN